MKNLFGHPLFTDRRKRYTVPRIVIGSLAGILPFIIIFRKVDFEKLVSALWEVSWWALPALLACSLLAMILQGTRWWILIRAFTRQLSWKQSLSLHFKSSFYSLFIPNSTMQEVIRSVVASKHIGSVISWSSAWVNKVTGIVVAFTFSVAGIVFLPEDLIPKNTVTIVGILFVSVLLMLVASFSKTVTRPLKGVVGKVLPVRLVGAAQKLHEGIYQFKHKKTHLVITLMVTVLVQLSVVLAISFLIQGITGQFLFIECLAFIPLIEMISMAQPLTPNGAGVREALIAIMFKQIGLSPEQLGVYIVLSNMSIFLRLLGAVPVLVDSIKKRH